MTKSTKERISKAYIIGYHKGQKDFAEKVKTKIETDLSWDMFDDYGNETGLHKELMKIFDSVRKTKGVSKCE